MWLSPPSRGEACREEVRAEGQGHHHPTTPDSEDMPTPWGSVPTPQGCPCPRLPQTPVARPASLWASVPTPRLSSTHLAIALSLSVAPSARSELTGQGPTGRDPTQSDRNSSEKTGPHVRC